MITPTINVLRQDRALEQKARSPLLGRFKNDQFHDNAIVKTAFVFYSFFGEFLTFIQSLRAILNFNFFISRDKYNIISIIF